MAATPLQKPPAECHICRAPGFMLRKKNAGHATLGSINLGKKEAPLLRVVSPTPIASPAYDADLVWMTN